MAFLPRPVTMMMLVSPEATASSMTYWMMGLSTSGSISLGWALVAGRKRVPSPAAGKTAFLIFCMAADASTTPSLPILRVALAAGTPATLERPPSWACYPPDSIEGVKHRAGPQVRG